MSHRGLLLACAVLMGLHSVSFAQTGQAANGYRVTIGKLSARIKVDGKLDEPVWRTIEPITSFTQTQPDEGAPVSERSEALIFYDDENIYFGFRCYDSHPDRMVHRLGYHDAFTGSDSINIMIDTFRDRRTGYFFSVNSRGIQYDGTVNESQGSGFNAIDAEWDGIWHSASSLESWGWSSEVVIPFKSIRLRHARSQEWGVNLSRDIVRRNENAYWVPVPRFEGFMRPSRLGALSGLEDVRVGKNLELIPFLRTAWRGQGSQPQLNGWSGTGGLDLRYGVRANLTANLAVNPDFGETEADEFTSTISRFEIFFPEKRKFFTEGANYFTTPLSLFFSRRIGARLPDGEPQRILEGGKLTGKIGGWTVGGLEAVTQRTDFIDPFTQQLQTGRGAIFGVLRLQRDILQKSSIGLISVNRVQEPGAVGQRESTHALDLSILSGQHIRWNSQAGANLNSANPGMNWQHAVWISDFQYDSDRYFFRAAGKFLGRAVDISHTGFEPEVDRWSGNLDFIYKPFINRYGIRQIFLEANYDESNDTRGALQDAGADADLQIQFKNFWTFHARYSYDRVRFFHFTPTFGRLPTTRVYQTPRVILALSTNDKRILYGTFTYQQNKLVQFNENFYGYQKLFQLNGTARIGEHLRWELNGILVREALENGAHFHDRRFVISRWIYQFTPKVRTRVLAQYSDDRHGSNTSINSLFAYDFTSRSALFVGYNRQRRHPRDPADLGNQVFVKLSYLFAF